MKKLTNDCQAKIQKIQCAITLVGDRRCREIQKEGNLKKRATKNEIAITDKNYDCSSGLEDEEDISSRTGGEMPKSRDDDYKEIV